MEPVSLLSGLDLRLAVGHSKKLMIITIKQRTIIYLYDHSILIKMIKVMIFYIMIWFQMCFILCRSITCPVSLNYNPNYLNQHHYWDIVVDKSLSVEMTTALDVKCLDCDKVLTIIFISKCMLGYI